LPSPRASSSQVWRARQDAAGLIGFTILCVVALIYCAEGGELVAAAVLLGTFVFFYVVILPRIVKTILRGRQMRARRAIEALRDSKKSPVLLIRSFADDDLIDPAIPTTSRVTPGRYEESLVRALAPIGPAISLGRPGEPQPELGASRLYVEDKDWRTAITCLLERAQAVLAIVGPSEGLWWEIELALRQSPQERLLFFFPYPTPRAVRASYPVWRFGFEG
jgi:hypothetical protein